MLSSLLVLSTIWSLASSTVIPLRRSVHESYPVCIVGAGPSGLTIAHELEAKGQSVVVFESQPEVGGKCQVVYDDQGGFHPLGALLFVNETYVNTVPLIDDADVALYTVPDPTFNYDYAQDPISVQRIAPPDGVAQALILAELTRYTLFYDTEFAPKYQAIRYTNGVPDEFAQPIGQWLSANHYLALPSIMSGGMVAYGYGSLEQTPTIYALQYLTPNIISSFVGITPGYLVDFHAVFLHYSQSITGPLHLGANVVSIGKPLPVDEGNVTLTYDTHLEIDRTNNTPVIKYSSADSEASQRCSSVVLAFPPTLDALQASGLDLTPAEHDVFAKVRRTEYWSGAVHTSQIPGQELYLQDPPVDEAEPVGLWRLFNESDISSVYSWGPYGGNTTTEEAEALLLSTLSKLNFDPATQSPADAVEVTLNDVEAFRKWDYFPHFDEDDLKEDVYQAYNVLQGQKNTFYSSGLNGFETVEFAIRAGKDLVRTYF